MRNGPDIPRQEWWRDDDTTDNEDVESMVEDNEPNFVTLSRVQNKPILPPVIVMGGRLREAIEEDTMEDDDEGFVEGGCFYLKKR